MTEAADDVQIPRLEQQDAGDLLERHRLQDAEVGRELHEHRAQRELVALGALQFLVELDLEVRAVVEPGLRIGQEQAEQFFG